MFDEFFGQLKKPFPAKNLGEFKMYTTGCAFERDWDNGILEINQTAFIREKHGGTVQHFRNLKLCGFQV